MAKAPDPIDVEIGGKIKAQRHLMGMSQHTLAAALGVTFQQIQKYETGTIRVSSSRIAVIAKTFGLPPSYFFLGADDRGRGIAAAVPELVTFIETKEGRDLNVAFSRIRSPRVRRKIVGLVMALAAAL